MMFPTIISIFSKTGFNCRSAENGCWLGVECSFGFFLGKMKAPTTTTKTTSTSHQKSNFQTQQTMMTKTTNDRSVKIVQSHIVSNNGRKASSIDGNKSEPVSRSKAVFAVHDAIGVCTNVKKNIAFCMFTFHMHTSYRCCFSFAQC